MQTVSGNGTSITLSSSESVGKYRYRARVKGHTEADDGWQTSGDLYIIAIESIDGYIYGESDRKIEDMESRTEPANIVASGYIKFKATVAPDNLYFKWSTTAGTLTSLSGGSPEGAGNNYKEVKFDAPDGHEQNVTLTLEIKENVNGTAFHTETVDLKTIRPYVIRVKFVDDTSFFDDEQHLLENGSENDPEYDAKAGKNCPICYIRNCFMKVELDIAGNKTDDSGNNLTKKTEIKVTGLASYDNWTGIDFETTIIDDNTENWVLKDYHGQNIIALAANLRLNDEVAEYEDFKMLWSFKVKNSSGQWVLAYEETQGLDYSHETEHKETGSYITYGMYLINSYNKFTLPADFKKLTLEYACGWAEGQNSENDILQDILNCMKYTYHYTTLGNCWWLAKDFDHACKALGINSKLHRWEGNGSSIGDMYKMYPYEFSPIGPLTWEEWRAAAGNGEGQNDGWIYHVFVEADGDIYDPSAGVKNAGSWLNYETDCFKKYSRIIQTDPRVIEWEDNQPGISLGCESADDHTDNAPWPGGATRNFIGPSYGH